MAILYQGYIIGVRPYFVYCNYQVPELRGCLEAPTDITAQGDVVAVLRKPQVPYQPPSSRLHGKLTQRRLGAVFSL